MTIDHVSRPRAGLALGVLFTGAFVMGTAEMLAVGMLDLIATDLAVSVPAAGALVTANALGLAAGGPLLTLATTRLDRRAVLLGSIVAFVALVLLPVLAPHYALFVGARVLAGAAQGLFIAAGITTATAIVAPERTGRAMAVVISGFATASALGLPLGTLLGQAVGWRGAFAVVAAVAFLVLGGALPTLPSVPPAPGERVRGQLRPALAPRVLAVLLVCIVVFAAIQSALTYLVPYLAAIAGVSGAATGAFLLAYGIATTAGSALGGRFADVDAARTLVVGAIGVAASLLTLWLLGQEPVAAGLAVLGIGVFGMGMAPSMQHRVSTLSGAGAPLAASFPSSAVNIGIALGSLAGGIAIDRAGLGAIGPTATAIAVCAIAVAASTLRLHAPATADVVASTAKGR